MADINSFASDKLLDFIDAAHAEIVPLLRNEFGESWIDEGVRKHLAKDSLEKVEAMLQSPMRVVDMRKTPEDVYGIEHLWQIINGNWTIFRQIFENRQRTETYLSEITELRHNLAHRRTHHVLPRVAFIRVLDCCSKILAAMGSPKAVDFEETVESLTAGSNPWGLPLAGRLPPSNEMFSEFVGRPDQLQKLADWLDSDRPQVLIWGYGGVGKSALAYQFAREVRDGGHPAFIATCWVSAKTSQFVEGATSTRPADFDDLPTLVTSIWDALFGESESPSTVTPDELVKQLMDLPILLVVDDFDTVSEDVPIAEFLLYRLRQTPTRVIYTSRRRQPGIDHLDVPPFPENELAEFVRRRAAHYSIPLEAVSNRVDSIASVTDGYPLYVDDLLRHARFVGIKESLEDWSQRRGDAARQYALKRQIEFMSSSRSSSGDVLIALSIASQPLSIGELAAVTGLTIDDCEAGAQELDSWHMATRALEYDNDMPVLRLNRNTGRLVEQTFRTDRRVRTYSDAFKALSGDRVPEAQKIMIGRVINRASDFVHQADYAAAAEYVHENMTGDLANSADLYSMLGRIHFRQSGADYIEEARKAFENAHRFGSKKIENYAYWAELERSVAEELSRSGSISTAGSEAIADQWKRVEDVCLQGISRCGSSQILYYWAGYGASREAKAKARVNNFAYAEASYKRAIDHFRRAKEAPVWDMENIPLGRIFRGIVIAQEGIGVPAEIIRVMQEWRSASGRDFWYEREAELLRARHPDFSDQF